MFWGITTALKCENLPLSFPAAQDCNLIFVLPLNSDFEQEPNSRSLLARISRVLDVQQGALERNCFKLLYLFNENAALRNYIKQLWNTRGAHIAFDVMYDATVGMLSAFDFTGPQKGPHVAMVRRSGTHFLDHEF